MFHFAGDASLFFGHSWWQILGKSTTDTSGLKGIRREVTSGVTVGAGGPSGLRSWSFPGKSTSFVKLTNNGAFNFGGSSWSIGTFFYQDSLRNGPIVEWRGKTGNFGTHFWIWGSTLFTNLDPTSGIGTYWEWKAPILKKWIFIGVSYNHLTGDACMWMDDQNYCKKTGKLQPLDQQGDVYIGIRPGSPTFYPLLAKLAGLTILKYAVKMSEVNQFKSDILKAGTGGPRKDIECEYND